MGIDQVMGALFNHVLGRMLRRILFAAVFVALAVIAIYYFTIAGTLALEQHFSAIEARLIVGGIFGFIALVCAICWLVLGRPANSRAPALAQNHDVLIAMLVEAVMLGYALSRKTQRSP